MQGIVFRAALQCQFASEKVRLANLAIFCFGVWTVCSGKKCLVSDLAKIEADERCWPFGHVDLSRGLSKSAWHTATPVQDVAPQDGVSVLGTHFARLAEVGQCLRQIPRIEVCKSAIEIHSRLLW